MPSAISVNMLRLRLITDAQPRSKNGQPAQSTTGVARRSCSQFDGLLPQEHVQVGEMPAHLEGQDRAASSTSPIQKRRVMSASSGFGPASAVTSSGSSAMPQIGQLPGPTCRTSGCIGQV